MCFHFDEIRTWHRCLKLSFFGLYICVRYLKTVPFGWAMIEIIFTRPLTIYKSSEPINSALFSRAKPLRSPRPVKLNSFNFDWKRCNRSKGFRALFVYCICSNNDSFLSVFSKASFFSNFFFRFSIMCRRVFNKTIILLGLAGYEMIITNSALRASLVIYHFISSVPS